MNNLIRIDLAKGSIKNEEINKEHKLFKYAGRSLSSKIVYDEVPPQSDPLSDSNKIIFSCGFFSGTPVPNSGRMSIGGKSPLTGGIKEANCGGHAPSLIARHGIRGIIVENSSQSWKIIKIEHGKVELIDATEYVNTNTYELASKLQEKYGEKIGILSIGIAGEKLFPNASIQSVDMEGYPSRAAARGGLGSIMGSKKIKALVIVPPKEKSSITYHNFDSFKKTAKEWFMELYKAKRTFSKYGTAIMVNVLNALKGLPTKNFRIGEFEGYEKINGDYLNDYIEKNSGKCGVACSPGCAIMCSNIVKDAKGNHITSSLEYETIALNGSNLMIDDIEIIGKIDQLCDDIGLDTIETGNTLAVMMEAGWIEWGDGESVIKMLEGMKEGNEKSLKLGLGAYRLAKELGIERNPSVKKQGLPGYDPRTFKGMGVTFMTSPMGADHTAGPAIKGRKAFPDKEYGELEEAEGKVLLSQELQIFVQLIDSCGLCYFVGPSWENTITLAKLLKDMYDWTISPEDLMKLAREWLLMENDYNVKAGISPVEDFPKFLREEPEEASKRMWDVKDEEIKPFWDTI